MAVPTVVLAVLSIAGGWLVLPGRDLISAKLAPVFPSGLPEMGGFNWAVTATAVGVAVAGIVAAWALCGRASEIRAKLRLVLAPLRALLMNAYYADTIYHWLFEVPALTLASDVALYIDPDGVGGVTAGVARATAGIGDIMRSWETGYLRRYGLTMVIGMVLVLALYLYLVHGPAAVGMK
jgi:NADH-quinone oxidoreductase subunit L